MSRALLLMLMLSLAANANADCDLRFAPSEIRATERAFHHHLAARRVVDAHTATAAVTTHVTKPPKKAEKLP